MRNVDLVGGTFRKHSRETRRAFRILIVGKFLIYKKQERENAAGIDSGKCLIYAFRLKKKKMKYSIEEKGWGNDDIWVVNMKKKKGEKESERERKKEREIERDIIETYVRLIRSIVVHLLPCCEYIGY